MGAVIAMLPLIVDAFKLAPTLIKTGMEVYEGARAIWNGVTAEHPATPEQQAEYDAAEQAAFEALMESTKDVATDGAGA